MSRRLIFAAAAQNSMRELSPGRQDEVLDALRPLLTGPIPPSVPALPDPWAPDVYELHTAHLLIKVGLHDDLVRVWIIRPYQS